jgi:hypothetical protein
MYNGNTNNVQTYPTVTMKCITAMQTLFIYINMYLSIMFGCLSCSLTSVYFLTYSNTNIHVSALSWLGTGTVITNSGVN